MNAMSNILKKAMDVEDTRRSCFLEVWQKWCESKSIQEFDNWLHAQMHGLNGPANDMQNQRLNDLEKIFSAGAKAEFSAKEPQSLHEYLAENEELAMRLAGVDGASSDQCYHDYKTICSPHRPGASGTEKCRKCGHIKW